MAWQCVDRSECMQVNHTLTSIDLEDSNVSDDDLTFIDHLLRVCRQLFCMCVCVLSNYHLVVHWNEWQYSDALVCD